MPAPTAWITGSCGLIGSKVSVFLARSRAPLIRGRHRRGEMKRIRSTEPRLNFTPSALAASRGNRRFGNRDHGHRHPAETGNSEKTQQAADLPAPYRVVASFLSNPVLRSIHRKVKGQNQATRSGFHHVRSGENIEMRRFHTSKACGVVRTRTPSSFRCRRMLVSSWPGFTTCSITSPATITSNF